MIPAATLTSPREGLDKNMHKALQVKEHADIMFRLLRLEPRRKRQAHFAASGCCKSPASSGRSRLDITTARKGAALSVQGEVHLLMTDFGIKPPTAMLGMLKTDPKVTVDLRDGIDHSAHISHRSLIHRRPRFSNER